MTFSKSSQRSDAIPLPPATIHAPRFYVPGCGGDHPQPMLGFPRFFAADANFVLKILFGSGVIRFAVIGAHAGAGMNNLADQWTGHCVLWNRFCKTDYCFTENCRALFQVKCAFRLIIRTWSFFSH
ncbi:MAG TPA: hypothetical protein VMB80_11020 [Candidatus Acidoferrum sp.]|nr:hypothetical protein [Candidatus Acidoferrum sp.]